MQLHPPIKQKVCPLEGAAKLKRYQEKTTIDTQSASCLPGQLVVVLILYIQLLILCIKCAGATSREEAHLSAIVLRFIVCLNNKGGKTGQGNQYGPVELQGWDR